MYSSVIDSGGGWVEVKSRLWMLMKSSSEVAGVSMGVPSGLRPMSARRVKDREKALFMADVLRRKTSKSVVRHIEDFIFLDPDSSREKRCDRSQSQELRN
jgi:hypothetical protein